MSIKACSQDLQKISLQVLYVLSKGSQHTDTFYISPTTPKEISDLRKTLNNNKSLVLNSIPTNILKEIHKTISTPLFTLK